MHCRGFGAKERASYKEDKATGGSEGSMEPSKHSSPQGQGGLFGGMYIPDILIVNSQVGLE